MTSIDIQSLDIDFVDIRLPEDVERGMLGGPEFKTSIVPLRSGKERRNIVFEQPRNKWNVTYGIMSIEDDGTREECIEEIKSFFYIVQGNALGFRFKDWSDFCLFRQPIGIESDQPMQVYKRYAFDNYHYDRKLTKIVQGTMKVWSVRRDPSGNVFDEIELPNQSHPTNSYFSIDIGTGLLRLHNRTPDPVREIEVECEFDVPVRFDNDNLGIETEHAAGMGAASIPSLSILEIKE